MHVSELANRFVRDPAEVVKVGDRIRVKMLKIDGERRRIGLSLASRGRGVMTARLASVRYTSGDGGTTIPSYLASPDGDGPHPAVLILRGVAGPDDGYTEIARRLAEWGYVALLHGWKIRGANPPDAPVYDDLKGALTFLRSVDQVDQTRLAVFGFCRGGVHALMAARAHAGDPRHRRLPWLRLPAGALPCPARSRTTSSRA